MGKRFAQDTEDTHRIWIFPFANLVLRYERMLSTQKLAKYRSGTPARCAAADPGAFASQSLCVCALLFRLLRNSAVRAARNQETGHSFRGRRWP